MRLLSDEEIAQLRAKYPERKPRVRKKVEPVLTTKVLRAFTRRAIKSVNNELKNSVIFRQHHPKFLRKKPRRPANVCCHWCPITKHEWQHVIADPGGPLDAWELPCPEHTK